MEEDRFTVALHQDEKGVSLLYLVFQPSDEVLRDMTKAGIFGAEARDLLTTPQKSAAELQP